MALRGMQDAFASVARSPTASFALALGALALGVLTLVFANAIAGAIIIGALVVAFSMVGLYGFVIRDRFGGLYEVMSDHTVWEIIDPRGETQFTRTKKLRFLQDGVFAVRDYAWGNGSVGNDRDDYECTPGYPADFYESGGRQNVIISLRDTRKRGETQELVVKRRMHNMFPKDSEWVAMEPVSRTEIMGITIVFPANRPPSAAWWKSNSQPEQDRKELTPVGAADGRQMVSVEIPRPALRQTYTVWWDW